MLKAIHASEDRAAARAKVLQVVAKLHELKLPAAAALVQDHSEETFSYYASPIYYFPVQTFLRSTQPKLNVRNLTDTTTTKPDPVCYLAKIEA